MPTTIRTFSQFFPEFADDQPLPSLGQVFNAAEEEDEREEKSLADRVLEGALLNSQPGTNPLDQTFDDFFRQHAPARRLLFDTLSGAIANEFGQKRVSLRDRLFGEFQQRQRLQVQQQNEARREVIELAQLEERRKENRLNREFRERLSQLTIDQRDRALEQTNRQFEQRMGLSQEQVELQRQKLDLDKRKFDAAGEKLPDSMLESARVLLRPTIENNFDLNDTQQSQQAARMIVDFANQMIKERAKLTGEKTPTFRIQSLTDGFGRKRFIMIDPRVGGGFDALSGQAVTSAQKDFSAEELKRLNRTDDAVARIEFLSRIVQEKPDLVGKGVALKQALPPIFSEGFGLISSDEKNVSALLQDITLDKTNFITGAQVTDRERQFIQRTLPTVAGDKDFISEALVFSGAVMKAVAMRTRLGLLPGQLDFSDIILAQQEALKLANKEGKRFNPLSATRLLELTAEQDGREDVLREIQELRAVGLL